MRGGGDHREEFDRARKALLGDMEGDERQGGGPGPVVIPEPGSGESEGEGEAKKRTHSQRSAAILAQWATARGFGSVAPGACRDKVIETRVPLRYAAGLERFCHVPPRVTVE